MQQLQQMLHDSNNYVRSFKCALEDIQNTNFQLVINADKRPPNEHARRFNALEINEVAMILAGDQCGKRDIIIKCRDSIVQRLSDTHRSYDALQYPLLFPFGQDGYHFGIPHAGENARKTVSCMDFYALYLMFRPNNFNLLHRSRDLFQQFVVDMWVKTESERLLYIRTHQKELRVDSYVHLRDSIQNDGNVNNLGKLCILPSSFTGGPRYMHERTQDAMTYVRKYGRPDLFITFTCNPKWSEIQQELLLNQKPHHRHDLLARVFHLKLIKLMHLITKSQIFGEVRCSMYTVEWQKRGLPHAHLLIWLVTKINSNQLDSIISAEIPDPETDRPLYDIVKTHMVHGRCGYQNLQSPWKGSAQKSIQNHFFFIPNLDKMDIPHTEEGNQKMEEGKPKLEFMRLIIDG